MKYAIVDFRIDNEEEQNLRKLGLDIIKCPPCKKLYDSICGHPDILTFFINNKKAVVHKDIDTDFIKKLNSINVEVLLSKNSLSDSYPRDVILNALNLPDFFVHKLKYTDPTVINNIENKKLINVNQGYTKCSCAVICKDAIITSDISISRALKNESIDVLLIPPGDILLPGLDYGFIGGSCGAFDNYVVFFGNLKYYSYGSEVLKFLEKHNMKPVFLRDGKLIDRGSIFFI
ncbi:DUF6873 family GME fold protein [Clostridium sp.]|jgi:hypothetical protein|uniref:DUF6873 family GME fold protein n=1 Tax=Clostridium sp. TaxID=1506 RepID=UPI003A5BCBCC